ncbi:trypsin-like peptidase domain-containing protein [Intrasporangium sp.]|uniref:S1C family serine protease n=1 Tax=Intrasporangium sp. TaxID=1925024 RepID=UPI003221900A
MTMAPGTHNPMSAVPPPPGPEPTPPGHRDPEPERRPRRRIVELTGVALLAAVLASGGTYAALQVGGGGATPATSSQTLVQGDTSPTVIQGDAAAPDWTAVAKAVTPSVVSITVTLQNGEAQGSGVIIDGQAHVLTNNHVVAGATKGSITVSLNDGRTYAASIVGTDPSTDLAVVKIEGAPADLIPMTLGNSDTLSVGDPVMAVGNPLGLSGTVTTGIISALDRPVTTQSSEQNESPFGEGDQTSSDTVVTNAIQTSAAINPGNSGGALVNAKGELIGINSSIAELGNSGPFSSGQSGNIGIGFAIPVNEAKTIASQLIEKGHAEHAFLGVSARDAVVTDGAAKRAGAEVVQVVPDTPAAKGGVEQGDVIIMVNGERIESSTALVAQIREMQAGQQAKLTVVRKGQRQELTVTLAVKPAGSD